MHIYLYIYIFGNQLKMHWIHVMRLTRQANRLMKLCRTEIGKIWIMQLDAVGRLLVEIVDAKFILLF